MRSPKHPFHIRHMPFALCPFMCAPVRPGETVKNILLQSRAVSKTMVNSLIGAWMEYYFFYVKFSDIDHVAGVDVALKDMILTPERAMTDIDTTAADETFRSKVVTTPGGDATQISYMAFCLQTVLNNFFRDGDETYTLAAGKVSNGVHNEYMTHMKPGKGFEDSAIQATEWESKDIDVDLDADATITAEEVLIAMAQWEALKAGRLTDMTFEDYLRGQGVNAGLAQDASKPELLRVIRDFSYPVNTVDPADGDPSTAFSWSITETANKDRFIKEPGFIFGASCFRPKVYSSEKTSLMCNYLNRVWDWLPNHPAAVKKFNGTVTNSPNESDGPWDTIADDYMVDSGDLFLYGEEFVNFTLGDADANLIAVPGTDLTRKYTTKAQMDTLFQGATAADAMSQDGIVSLSILGAEVDDTPTAAQEDD